MNRREVLWLAGGAISAAGTVGDFVAVVAAQTEGSSDDVISVTFPSDPQKRLAITLNVRCASPIDKVIVTGDEPSCSIGRVEPTSDIYEISQTFVAEVPRPKNVAAVALCANGIILTVKRPVPAA